MAHLRRVDHLFFEDVFGDLEDGERDHDVAHEPSRVSPDVLIGNA
jgi:hypothetical protein